MWMPWQQARQPAGARAGNPLRHSTSAAGPASSSVDPHEVSHFDRLAASWWDPHGPSRILHLMNPLRHDFIARCLASTAEPPPPALRYLDIGCGGGVFTESAARLDTTAAVLGVDPSRAAIGVAEAHARQDPALAATAAAASRLRYRAAAVEDLPADETADVVTLFEVIEHCPYPSAFLDAVTAHVQPGGWLVLSTISRTWSSWFTTKLMAEYVLRMVPTGMHDWNRYINADELEDWFAKRAGWESPRLMGVAYLPGIGWKEIPRGESIGNYFFAIRKLKNRPDLIEEEALRK